MSCLNDIYQVAIIWCLQQYMLYSCMIKVHQNIIKKWWKKFNSKSLAGFNNGMHFSNLSDFNKYHLAYKSNLKVLDVCKEKRNRQLLTKHEHVIT